MTMAQRAPKFKEGDCFALPLKRGGYALGLIARMNNHGVIGYFFGTRYRDVPKPADLEGLRLKEAIQCLKFSDMDLRNRSWPIVGSLPAWERQHWPMPSFAHIDVVSGQPYIRNYDENSLNFVSERKCTQQELVGLPEDGDFGSGAVVIRISRLVGETNTEPGNS